MVLLSNKAFFRHNTNYNKALKIGCKLHICLNSLQFCNLYSDNDVLCDVSNLTLLVGIV